MKFLIKDFVDMHAIEVEPMHHDGDRLVLITQRSAGMTFQHTMRIDQAMFLASALHLAIEEAEKMATNTNTLEAQP